jgi:molybdate transport system substrate-binding protein
VPEVPIGRYTLAIFKKAAATYGDAFGKTLDSHIASRELNVRQVLAKVSLGEADAGVVYRSDAAAAKGAVDTVDIPTTVNVVAEYAVAPVKTALQPALARQWCDLLLSTEGSAVLAKAGFLANDLAASAPPDPKTRNERQP